MAKEPDASNPRWDKTLDSRGIEGVRILLAQSPGPGAGAVVRGLGNAIEDMPTRDYAERWLTRKVAEQQEQQERLAKKNITIGIVSAALAGLAALVALLAWLFPVK